MMLPAVGEVAGQIPASRVAKKKLMGSALRQVQTTTLQK
jgi:hypothetical protein